jgi:hypothetical protein
MSVRNKETRRQAGEPGLDGRKRDARGSIPEKQGDIRLGTLRQTYGEGSLRAFVATRT